MDDLVPLLQALISAVARGPIPEAELRKLVGAPKQQQAFDLCDGTRRQSDIVRQLKLDSANFSKTISRWIDLGIVYRVGEGNPRHIYPLGTTSPKAPTSVARKSAPKRRSPKKKQSSGRSVRKVRR